MKRYMVFAGKVHYPDGGMRDFVGDYASKTQAIYVAKKERVKLSSNPDNTWAEIFDIRKHENVVTFGKRLGE